MTFSCQRPVLGGLFFFTVRGFLSLQRAGTGCGAWAYHSGGFTCCRARAPEHRRFSSCGHRALSLHGVWDLPGPGLEPASPAPAGRFFITVPPGKEAQRPYFFSNKSFQGNSLAVPWLGLCCLGAKGPGLIPGQGIQLCKLWSMTKKY